tara:strand:+ start:44 stop:442 length:399 start_codon:yes stop_codon:yes gene_type:complete
MASNVSSSDGITELNDPIVVKNVERYLDFKTQIKAYQKKINELKVAQKLVENEIQNFMKHNDIPAMQLNDKSQLKLTTRESKKGVTPKWMKDELIKVSKSDNVSDEAKFMMKEIISKIDNRPTTSKELLVHK